MKKLLLKKGNNILIKYIGANQLQDMEIPMQIINDWSCTSKHMEAIEQEEYLQVINHLIFYLDVVLKAGLSNQPQLIA